MTADEGPMVALSPDGLIHAVTPDDIRVAICGRWIGDETWELIHAPVTCPECVR